MRYKIIYHVGEAIDLKTNAENGVLLWQENTLEFSGSQSLKVPHTEMVSVEMFRLNGLGRMIKIVCVDQTIYLSVVRFTIGQYFAIVNFMGTGSLFNRLKKQVTPV